MSWSKQTVADLKYAYAISADDPDEAARICNAVFRDSPDNAAALYLLGSINAKAERYAVALPIYNLCTQIAPHRHEAWNNLGMCYVDCLEFIKARECFKTALKLKPDEAPYMANLGATYASENNYAESIRWNKKALKLKPDNDGAAAALGFAQLATGDWKNGWKNFDYCLGGRFRKIIKIGEEPKWNGDYVDHLFIYGEQGLGDEIMYASCLNDIKVGHIALECDKRLEGLFQRSFPNIEVHGTRREDKPWAEGRTFDAGSAMGSLPSIYRPLRESCPGTPYLVADPERRVQWRALFDYLGRKPKIGLCWSGGRAMTGKRFREVGVEAFEPLLDTYDADWFSLQYQDPDINDSRIRHYKRAVQSKDYDDTAAFVAELDLVIGVNTTAQHLAGALGVPSIILVPQICLWNYYMGDSLPWYGQNKYHRQKKNEKWIDCIRRLDLSEHLLKWKEAA